MRLIEVGNTVRLKDGKRLAKVIYVEYPTPKQQATRERTSFAPLEPRVVLNKPLKGFRTWGIESLEVYAP
jgi:hypothetical protein